MNWLMLIVTYIISYAFGAISFPQIIGSLRMIRNGTKNPYVFTLLLWTTILIVVTILVRCYLHEYFIMYLVALILPFVFTLKAKEIQ